MKLLLFASLFVAAEVVAGHVRTEDLSAATYFNKSTSSFVEIIKTQDLKIRDTIYTTPAVIFIGKENGEILRCLQREPEECEVFYKGSSLIHALLVTEENLYAGLYSGSILNCDLYKVDSCNTFHTGSSEIVSLSAAGGYLYASQYSPSTILRCDLNQPNSCKALHKMTESFMWTFSHYGKYIYVGQNNGKIFRCSLRADSSCTFNYELSSSIRSFANIENNIYAVTSDGKLWNCTRRSDETIDKCLSMTLQIPSPTAVATYNGQFYVVNSMGFYNMCSWTNDTCFSCAHYAKPGARSMAIAYKTYQMQNRYEDEQMACTWQSNYKCPPFVTYYDSQERYMFEVHVKNGRLYNSQGYLVDTSNANKGCAGPAAIFAMGPDGRLLLSNTHLRELLHTSSLFAGRPVAAAGEIVVIKGVITNVIACAEHYQPDTDLNRQVVESLRTQGYTGPIDLKICDKVDENSQMESNNVQ